MFLSVAVSPDAFFSVNPAPAAGYQYTQIQQYYLDTATWLGESYGHHPALAGFYITNETNQPGPTGTYQYREYWDFLNKVGQALKAGAPGKLTIAAMQDDISTLTTQLMQYVSTPVAGGSAPATELLYVTSNGAITTSPNGGVEPPAASADALVDCGAPHRPAYATDIYALDLWGWNLYAAASDATPIIAYLKQAKAAGQPMAPVVLSEIGIPQAMRYTQVANVGFGSMGLNDPYVVNPNGDQAIWTPSSPGSTTGTLSVTPYISGTILGHESLAVVTTTSTSRTSTSFFTDYPSYNAGGLVAYDSDTTNYYLFQGVPQNPSDPGLPTPTWVELDKTVYGTLLDGLRTTPIAPATARRRRPGQRSRSMPISRRPPITRWAIQRCRPRTSCFRACRFSNIATNGINGWILRSPVPPRSRRRPGCMIFAIRRSPPGAPRTRNSTPVGRRSGSACVRCCRTGAVPPLPRSIQTGGWRATAPIC